MRVPIYLASTVLAASGCAGQLVGQTVVGAPKPCQEAFARVRAGNYAEQAAARVATRCGVRGGIELAAALNAARLESDPARIDAITRGLDGFLDQAVFTAALAIVADAAASTPARLGGILALAGHLDPGSHPGSIARMGAVAPDGETPLCAYPATSHTSFWTGAQLQANYRATAVAALRALATSPSAPLQLRAAARCAAPSGDPGPSISIPTASPSQIRLTYICGNSWRVRNSDLAGYLLTFDVYNQGESGSVDVLARDPSMGSYDVYFGTVKKGTVRLFHNGVLIQTKANGNKVCSA